MAKQGESLKQPWVRVDGHERNAARETTEEITSRPMKWEGERLDDVFVDVSEWLNAHRDRENVVTLIVWDNAR